MLPLLGSFAGQAVPVKVAQATRLSGFDLRDCLIPTDQIRSQAAARDQIEALGRPQALDAEALAELNFDRQTAGLTPYLAAADLVAGLELEGEFRAYPLAMLSRHQIVNDNLQGRAVLISYCPLSDALLAFRREQDGRELEFGVSGLLHNSNMLMFDRARRGEESLWSQLRGQAVSGPLSGRELEQLPLQLIDWGSWLELHPGSSVAVPELEELPEYTRDAYADYRTEARLRYPAWPQLPEDSPLHAFEQVIAVDNGSGWLVLPLRQLRRELGSGNRLELHGARFILSTPADPDSEPQVLVEALPDADIRFVHAYWFAWYAMHPESKIFPLLD
ncbi:MAG: DUF3179 domain-containing (seleno)protein [bacterium]